MIYLGCFAPHGWEITQIAAAVPMAITTLASHIVVAVTAQPIVDDFEILILDRKLGVNCYSWDMIGKFWAWDYL
jgi:hypothetical protein